MRKERNKTEPNISKLRFYFKFFSTGPCITPAPKIVYITIKIHTYKNYLFCVTDEL